MRQDLRQEDPVTEDNADITRSFYDAFNARDFDRGAGLVAQEGEIVLAGSGDTFHGPDGAKQFFKLWADGFPDARAIVDRVISSGEQVVVQFTGQGTHTGTFAAPTGALAPTGRAVTLLFCDVLDVRGGTIASLRSYFDTASLLMQIGLMPISAESQR